MTTTFGNSNGGGDDKGGGGMSRAAKKRLKKKQKAQAQAQAQEQQQQQLQARSKSKKEKKRKSSADGDDVDDEAKKADERSSSSKKMRLLESDDEGDGDQPSDDDMQIAEVSKGELDYLESQGVKVTKKKKKKKNKSKKKADDSEDDGDDSSYRDDDGDAVDATEEEREEKEILLSLAQNLTPSQILFPGGDNDDDDDDNDEDAPEHGGAMMDPRRILQDLTSTSRARVLFESLLAPSGVTADEFYKSYWEKKPLLIAKPKVSFAADGGSGSSTARTSQDYKTRLDNVLSKKDIETMMAKCSLRYGRELNVTRYADAGDGSKTKRRITLDLPPKRVKKKSGKSSSYGQEEEDLQPVVADPRDVWSNFASGCTVRLLCPHLHSDSVHSLLSTLELEFGCMVGSNAYLTPGGDSQGFAPHYDDIEAFILQLEGRKRWRVYPPPNKAETLPRFSSRDYTEEDMEGTAPVIDTVLEPGDILYMPRGWIHQAHTPPSRGGQGDGGHSLHLTASAMQQWAWADLLDIIMPEALEAATASETSTSLREGLPRNFVNYMGAMYDTSNDDDAPEGLKQANAAKRDEMDEDEYEELVRQRKMKRMQDKFCEEANKRIMRVCKEAMAMVNAGCDQIGKRFLSDRQPPALTPNEAVLTSEQREENGGKIWPNTMCRLARPGIARLVLEDDKAVLYHCSDNSRVYHGTPLSPLEFEVDDAPALEMLLTTTEPHWICVKDLIHGDIEDKMEIAQSLYDEGILAILQTDRPDRSVQTG